MKRKTLTSAVLAGVTGVAGIASISSAVNLNPDGLGEVLIYPFYTVDGGNDTLISVVNTTDVTKAVKVRFLERDNSVEVLDFNLYLSPFDVWVAAVTRDPAAPDTGPAVVAVADNSCTVPTFFGNNADGTINGLPFERFRTIEMTDAVGPSNARTREGYVEMIEMGELDPTTGFGLAAVHVNGVPLDCGALNAAWAPGGTFTFNAGGGVTEPNGGLFGGGSIINVLGGFQASYNADAIAGFYDPEGPGALSELDLHTAPSSLLPSLNSADTGGDLVTSNVFDNARVITSEWSVPIDAVSAVFMRDQVFNEYATDDALDAATEWVLTFPTKRAYVNPGIVPPFTSTFTENGACEFVDVRFWDREEATPVGGIDFSPIPDAGRDALCWEAQVLSFGQQQVAGGSGDTTVLGYPAGRALDVPVDSAGYQNGWARIILDDNNQGFVSVDDDDYAGLPVTGFAVQVVRNSFIVDPSTGETVLSNYAGMFDHRYSRDIIGS